jgi:hypothetical protein
MGDTFRPDPDQIQSSSLLAGQQPRNPNDVAGTSRVRPAGNISHRAHTVEESIREKIKQASS